MENKVISTEYVKKNFIEKKKIIDKMRKLEKEANYRSCENPMGRIHFYKEPVDYQILILSELLEENND